MTGRPTTGEARIRLREHAARLYIDGASIPAVAQQIGRSYGTARALLLEAGVRLRKPGGSRMGGAQ
ncbi:helix-turn-helix domain-containing protein [Streptomyces sp. NPDC091383]|uniref:helix-turn-helix domain-containing protein n=1 Tax=Streptomyces sp. NPDC091383 TaxID=3365996 RepID=UPI00380E57E1